MGPKEELQVIEIVDASYKSDVKKVGGIMLMIEVRIWRECFHSKKIDKVYTSSKEAETRALAKIVDEAVFVAENLERILFGSGII